MQGDPWLGTDHTTDGLSSDFSLQRWRKPGASKSVNTSLGRRTHSVHGCLACLSPSVMSMGSTRPPSATAAQATAGVWIAMAARWRAPGPGPGCSPPVSPAHQASCLGRASQPNSRCLRHAFPPPSILSFCPGWDPVPLCTPSVYLGIHATPPHLASHSPSPFPLLCQ